jgi:hypothetical protein
VSIRRDQDADNGNADKRKDERSVSLWDVPQTVHSRDGCLTACPDSQREEADAYEQVLDRTDEAADNPEERPAAHSAIRACSRSNQRKGCVQNRTYE